METYDQLINKKGLEALIRHAVKNTYRTRSSDTVSEGFLQNSIALFSKDYIVSIIDNSWGELCGHYPSKIVILEHNGHQQNTDTSELRELILRSRVARCRSRFVVPVILFNGKFICRSSTLSSGPEMYSRQLYNMVLGGTNDSTPVPTSEVTNANSGDWQMFSRVRNQDILLLKKFNVGFIVDLMVEKKKVKYGLNVTSSEKVDKENRYAEFGIASIPFPGCEFFKEWKDNNYRTKGLSFDWTQGFVDAALELPTSPPPPANIDWTKYKEWDIVTLTQNYLKLILSYLKQTDSGFLVHCISGWDRTPMFISLVRLSLWSEGLIHQSLAPHEILYLTIAYDWYLFGHNFPDRIYKGEDVFYFCFHFLKYITDEEFNIYHRPPLIPCMERPPVSKVSAPAEQESPFPLLFHSRSSTNSINSNHSNGRCDDVPSSEEDESASNKNADNSLETTIPMLSGAADTVVPAPDFKGSDPNVTPTNSTPDSSLDQEDANHNDQQFVDPLTPTPSLHSEFLGQRIVTSFQRNSEPVPVPVSSPFCIPDIKGSTPNSYGSWQMVGPNEMENYFLLSRRPSVTDTIGGMHVSERKMKLMAVHNLFISVYKSVSEVSVPESNSGLGLSNLFESLFGNYKA